MFYTGILSANRYYFFPKDALRRTLLPNPGHEYFLHSKPLNSQTKSLDCQTGREREKKNKNFSLDGIHAEVNYVDL